MKITSKIKIFIAILMIPLLFSVTHIPRVVASSEDPPQPEMPAQLEIREDSITLDLDSGTPLVGTSSQDAAALPKPAPDDRSYSLPQGWETILYEDPSGNFPTANSWVVRDDNPNSGDDYWDDLVCRYLTPNYSLWAADIGDKTDCTTYDNDMLAWMIYGPFDLNDALDAEMNFYYWLYSEIYHDYFGFYASNDGISFAGFGYSGNSSGWAHHSFDLTDYLGDDSVWVAFVFQSNESITYEGAYLDVIEIRKETGFPDDAYEHNDTWDAAYYPGYNWENTWLSTIAGYGIQADEDWYRIDVTAGYEHVLVDCTFTHSAGDIDIALYNSTGTGLVGYSISTTDNEHLDVVVPAPGTYYLRVFYGNAGNQYDLWWLDALNPDIRVEPSSLTFTETSGVALSGADRLSFSGSPDHPDVFMKNPAAVYCTELGYRTRNITSQDGGQFSVCEFPDGSICDNWDFFEGSCGQAYSYCATQGLKSITRTDGMNPFAASYAVCVDEAGNPLGAASDLMGLVDLMKPDENLVIGPVFGPSSPPMNEVTANPTSFTWRDYNGGDWTTAVKDQKSCGSCWAFSSVGITESAFNIAANDPDLDLNLSEQYLVTDCALDAGACDGGNIGPALDFIQNSGIPDENCLPYLENDCTFTSIGACDTTVCTFNTSGECSDYQCSDRCSDWSARLQALEYYTYMGYNPTADTIKTALIEHGPLAVAMNMNGSFNLNNVYTCTDNNITNHGVIIVGYDDAGGYWIVKNSWGTSWGPDGNGYFKVAYDNCAIQKYPYYAEASSGSLTIFNDGTAPLQITSITTLGSSCWLQVSPQQSLPAFIPPLGSMAIDVTVDTTCVETGTYTDTIRIQSNDPDENLVDVPVTLNLTSSDSYLYLPLVIK